MRQDSLGLKAPCPERTAKKERRNDMLFLSRSKAKDVIPLSPEEIWDLAVKTWEMVISYEKQGKIVAGGGFVSADGCYEIWNVDSNEELERLAAQIPMTPFCNNEFIPLTTHEHALESAKQTLAALRASKK